MSASVYARLVPKKHRHPKLPKINRPMRPRMVAWAGPAAFYPNRFYEIDKWYKARIDKPVTYPTLHTIDPARFTKPLSEILDDEPQENSSRTNIGFAQRASVVEVEKTSEERAVLERKSRKQELLIDIDAAVSKDLSVFHHYMIFDHLFGEGVFFHNVQNLEIDFGNSPVYHGNVLEALVTKDKPTVTIENLNKGGYQTLVMANLDGNPFEKNGQVLHWLVKDIPDGEAVNAGTEVLPYIQPLPFKGTGYHRVAFILFRHDTPLEYDFNLKSSLDGRVFEISKFYKSCEEQITPSALSFFQTTYDISVKEAFHTLGMTSPIYEYEYNEAQKPEQKEFPRQPMPFDLYMDMYRDPKDVEQELLEQRLQRAQLDDYQASKWLDPHFNENKRNLPAWQHARMLGRKGIYSALYKNAIKD